MKRPKRAKEPGQGVVPVERIPRAIFELRGHRVILDSDLAAIYGVRTSHLNQAVKRNRARFPDDFLMQVSADEIALMSQIVTSKKGRGGRRKPALAFTEHGAAQAANVINSPRAIAMSIFVVRAFMRLREYLFSTKAMARRLDELEVRIAGRLAMHDDAIAGLLSAMRELMNPPPRKRRSIGSLPTSISRRLEAHSNFCNSCCRIGRIPIWQHIAAKFVTSCPDCNLRI